MLAGVVLQRLEGSSGEGTPLQMLWSIWSTAS